MIKINDVVEKILLSDEEALTAASLGYMNYSKYAEHIHKKVEYGCMKNVGLNPIVVALSRIAKKIKVKHPMIQNVTINNVTSKSPLYEIVFEKNNDIILKLFKIYKKSKVANDDFFTMTLSTNDITVICSGGIREKIIKQILDKPLMDVKQLAAVGLNFDEKYYQMPNITYSLIRRIASKRIPLAETITTRTEIIFIFDQKYLSQVVELFI